MTITVNPVNDTPVSVNDDYSFAQDNSFFVPVLSNDVDVDSLNLSVTGVSQPTNGTMSVSGTGFLYTPNTGYTGSDMFTYQVMDDLGASSNVASVTLHVVQTNTPPDANSVNISTNEDTPLISTLSGFDIDGSTLTYMVDTQPANGTLSVTAT